MALSPGTKLGPYEIVVLLGAGGMGEVYRARDLRLNRVVAIKVLSSGLHLNSAHKQRFEREARAIASLNHPHICTVHDVGSQNGVEYLVMEYLEGETLASCLLRGALPIDRVLRHGIEISDALDAAHRHGVIHRDLKPSNIFLTSHGEAKVLDFGLAQMGDEILQEMPTLTSPARLTSPGTVVGTLSYMSPEQARGEELDSRTDIFSFGAVLYETATGKMAFPGKTAAIIFKAILDHPPSPLTSWKLILPERLDEIVSKALEKDRDLRYQSAADLRSDLKRLQRDSESARISVVPVGKEQKVRSKKRRTLYILAVTTMILLVAGLAWWIPRRRATQNQLFPATQRSLTRLTFDDGLQFRPTWSPDGRFIAYSSNRLGKFDIWVQQVTGGDPVQITKGPGHNWQPDWSPDGRYIVYRSEDGEGGLFVIPSLGGAGLERKIASFGFNPRWSPDSSRIVFDAQFTPSYPEHRFYIVGLDGGAPKEVLADFLAHHQFLPTSVTWHPDGKRLSVWGIGPEEIQITLVQGQMPNLWTVPLDGGTELKSEIAPAIRQEIGRVASSQGEDFSLGSSTFSWAPSGKAIYFDQVFRGVRNIWKMTMDPVTLRGTAIERLTAGPGPDAGAVASPDGTRLAFAAQSESVRTSLFSFDATSGQLHGGAQPLTSPGTMALEQSLSRDGQRIAFVVVRSGKWELWEKSVVDGRMTPVISDDDRRIYPQWSPEGRRLIYTRLKRHSDEGQLMMWSAESRTEEPIAAPTKFAPLVYDWSSDGREILVAQLNRETQRMEVWQFPLADAPHVESGGRKVISDPIYDIYQPQLSPNGRWVIFEATRSRSQEPESTLYMISATGGPWLRITDGKQWDDKPRWSPDGRMIYFLSRRGGFFNLWGIRFDPVHGKPLAPPFRVTAFDGPSLMVPDVIQPVALSLARDRFVLTTSEVSGSIWLLDNVGP